MAGGMSRQGGEQRVVSGLGRSGWRAAALVLFSLFVAGGCGSQAGPHQAKVERDPNVLVAYVACGLIPAVEQAQRTFERENPGKSVQIESGEPSLLSRRIEDGAVPDLLIVPGDAELGLLERLGYMDRTSRQTIGTLRLAIATRAGNPAGVASCQDLTRDVVKTISLATPGITSSGTYAKHALERLGLWERIQAKLTLKETPLASLKAVADGEADATIVYDPCLALQLPDTVPPGSIAIVAELPEAEQRPVKIQVAVHKRSPNALLTQRFTRILTSAETADQISKTGAPPAGEAAPQPAP
jgi:molybdate transport system substrate-binding protein